MHAFSVSFSGLCKAARYFPPRRGATVIAATLAIFSAFIADSARSAIWSGSSGVSIEAAVVQTDAGVDSGTDRSSSVILEPFYSFSGVGPRQDVTGRIGVEHQRFSGDGGQSTSPSLSLEGRTTLIERGLWFNTEASAVSTQVTSGGFTDNTPSGDDQTTTSVQLQLGPEFRYQATDDVVVSTNAVVGRTQYNGDTGERDISDSTSAGVEGDVQYAIGSRGHLLTVEGRFQHTEFDAGQGTSLGFLSIGSVVPISSRLQVYGRLGYDWLTFDEMESTETDSDDSISQVQSALGIRWQPHRRLALNAEYAERAFGRQPTVSMILLGRRSELEFRWSRDLQITQLIDTRLQTQLIGSNEDIGLTDAELNNESDSLVSCVGVVQSDECRFTTFVTDSETVQEELVAVYTLRGRISALSFSLGSTELTDLDGENGNRRNEAEVSFTRTLARNLSMTVISTLSDTLARRTTQDRSESQSIRASITWISR